MRPDESMELREKLRASLYLSHSEERYVMLPCLGVRGWARERMGEHWTYSV
jgi:hypothetical protein